MDKPKTKKWVSSRLVKKKEELGIPDKPKENKVSSKKSSKQAKKVSKTHRSDKSDKKFNSKRSSKSSYKKNSYKKGSKQGSKKRSFRRRKGPKHVVRMSNLPDDVTVNELNYLVSEWGDIGNINIKKYTNYQTQVTNCYIDFYNKEEAEYFVEAMDLTPFDNLIIQVSIMDFSSKDNNRY